MMITGAHSIIFSSDPQADRAFLRDVFDFPYVDAGGGRLIYGLPPAEVAGHPSESNDVHVFYLMCDDIKQLIDHLRERDVSCSQIRELSWGSLTDVTLPAGGKLSIYQPKHERPRKTLEFETPAERFNACVASTD